MSCSPSTSTGQVIGECRVDVQSGNISGILAHAGRRVLVAVGPPALHAEPRAVLTSSATPVTSGVHVGPGGNVGRPREPARPSLVDKTVNEVVLPLRMWIRRRQCTQHEEPHEPRSPSSPMRSSSRQESTGVRPRFRRDSSARRVSPDRPSASRARARRSREARLRAVRGRRRASSPRAGAAAELPLRHSRPRGERPPSPRGGAAGLVPCLSRPTPPAATGVKAEPAPRHAGSRPRSRSHRALARRSRSSARPLGEPPRAGQVAPGPLACRPGPKGVRRPRPPQPPHASFPGATRALVPRPGQERPRAPPARRWPRRSSGSLLPGALSSASTIRSRRCS